MKRILLILSLLFASFAYAEHEEQESDLKQYNFWWEQIPAVCSTSDEIQRWASDKNFIPVNMSVGRENGSPDGQIVYVVVYYINDSGQTFAGVSTPESPDRTCIVFRTFDLRINEGLINKGL